MLEPNNHFVMTTPFRLKQKCTLKHHVKTVAGNLKQIIWNAIFE